jgi:hypothetical protein
MGSYTPKNAPVAYPIALHSMKNSGMLFVYPSERPLSFWMKNTQIPLSIAFLDAGGRIINIETMIPFQTMIRYRSQTDRHFTPLKSTRDGFNPMESVLETGSPSVLRV